VNPGIETRPPHLPFQSVAVVGGDEFTGRIDIQRVPAALIAVGDEHAGISLTAAIDRDALAKTPLFARAARTLRLCEQLRASRVFDEAARARLRDPRHQFALDRTPEGKTRFRPVTPHTQTVSADQPSSRAWTFTNAFDTQPLNLRIEALVSAASAADSNAVLLADLRAEPAEQWKTTCARGVVLVAQQPPGDSDSLSFLLATNHGAVPRHAAWAKLVKKFEPTLDATQGKALQVEVESDGSGAWLAIRLESPLHIAFGAVADRYVPLDFAGRRTLTLVETESSRWSDLVWNDGKHAYNVYRETVNFGALESVSVWLHHLPPHRETRLGLGKIQAVPVRAAPVKNPRLTINGQAIVFPVNLDSGSWIEGVRIDNCHAFGPKGEPLGRVVPRGEWPGLAAGANSVVFDCDEGGQAKPRARVTIWSAGQAL